MWENLNIRNNFTLQRLFALFTGFVSLIFSWYTLILMTNKNNVYLPEKKQYIGLFIAFLMGILAWLKKCFTITPR